MTPDILTALHDNGYSFIPIPPPSPTSDGKVPHPRMPWKEYQRHQVPLQEALDFYDRNPTFNIAIVTGKLSNLTVIDVDVKHEPDPHIRHQALTAIRNLFPTTHPVTLTGSGGMHIYSAYSPSNNQASSPLLHALIPTLPTTIHVDIRSEGGFVIAPPSMHKSQTEYIWHPLHPPLHTIHKHNLPALPQSIRHALATQHTHDSQQPKDWNKIILHTTHGQRNHTLAQLTGLLANKFKDHEYQTILLPLLLAWNKAYVSPPLSDKELQNTVQSILNKHAKEKAYK